MDLIKNTIKAMKEELLEIYDIVRFHPSELCITIIFALCILLLQMILMAILCYPFYYSFYKIVEEINSIPPFSPFQEF